MRVTRVVVSMQRKVPHPVEEYASLSALVSLEAELGPEDVPGACVLRLQAEADDLADSHLRKKVAQLQGQARLARGSENAAAATMSRLDRLVTERSTRS